MVDIIIKLGSRYVGHPTNKKKKYVVFQIIIPKQLVDKLGWLKGDTLEINLGRDKNSVIIRKYEE